MDTNKNSYTLIYAVVMVIIVAFMLSFVSGVLKERQTANMEIDRKKQILSSLRVNLKGLDADALYKKLIVKGLVVSPDAGVSEVPRDAVFHIDIVKEIAKPLNERRLPVFVAEIDGQTKYVLSLRGTGLWGPLWGYVALDEDRNTIFGVHFSHAGETPGLGANITDAWFMEQFAGKRILDGKRKFVSVAVVKHGTDVEGSDQVDAVSGGTITSKGVENMLYSSLIQYDIFFQQNDASKQD